VSRARKLGAFINLDMEHYGLKQLTLDLFKRLEEEFSGYSQLGLVIQAYLRDSHADAEALLEWSRTTGHNFTVRLVKGAYWDFEKVIAAQRTWKVPVYLAKPETDANYEKITRLVLENHETVYPAFASHNVRSIAHAMVYAEKLGLRAGDYEFQMLYGMATPVRRALVELGHRVREYCPIGELVPGMAYLVRRLLENTSNEGFLRAKFSANTSITRLLEDPAAIAGQEAPERGEPVFAQPHFTNEPPLDFALESARRAMRDAISKVRQQFGRHYPLVIAGNPVETAGSLNSVIDRYGRRRRQRRRGCGGAGGPECVPTVEPPLSRRAGSLSRPGSKPAATTPNRAGRLAGFRSRQNLDRSRCRCDRSD
jgi:RHH-type proline utilization regulon transcriptional repressor/proline dehydrogenase/delta 1-pyrroline-5-carboxylate dehydrogenase